MKKRLLSVTAILVLCLALLSVTALAADTEGYGVTVNGVAVTSANADDVLSDSNPGKVSYDADTNTLTINGTLAGGTNISGNGTTDVVINGVDNSSAANGLTVNGAKDVTVTANSGSPAISGATVINCSGDVNITNNGRGLAVPSSLTITGAQDVEVTANSDSAAIGSATVISCTGNVSITNNGTGQAVAGRLTVNGVDDQPAQNVTVSANSSNPAISGHTAITCSGNVTITNEGAHAVSGALTVNGAQNVTVTANNGQAVYGTLTVEGAQNVKVTANSSYPAIANNVSITCSGNVEIVNKGDDNATAVQGTLTVNHAQDVTVTAKSNQAVSQTLTVNDAQNVTVTANSSSAAINDVDITCSGNVEIVNQGTGKAVGFTLTFQQSNGHSYTVKTGSSLEKLEVYAEKAEGETFDVKSLNASEEEFLNASAVKIESADHTPGEWEYNSTQHWRLCTVCGEALDQEDHTFSGSTCTVCGYTKPSSGGSYTPTYSITAPKTEHGSVTVSPGYAERGDTVTVAVKPDKGYTLETLTVTDKNGNEIELTSKGGGKYTFKMPGSKVTVKATFMEDNSMLNFFVDVFPGDYYYDAVLWAAENGITGGVDDTHFAPNATCTRAQAVTFLWRAAGCPAPQSHAMPFTDVAEGSYYYDAVLWAVEQGITKGTGDTTFSPNATCTRAQIVTFLWRSQKSPAAGTANPFTDVAADAYCVDAVLWAVKEDITNGTGNGTTFSPNDNCTRAQIVTFLYRSMK